LDIVLDVWRGEIVSEILRGCFGAEVAELRGLTYRWCPCRHPASAKFNYLLSRRRTPAQNWQTLERRNLNYAASRAVVCGLPFGFLWDRQMLGWSRTATKPDLQT